MSWTAVARKDFRDALRSRAFWGVSALFLLLVVSLSVAYAQVDEISGGDPSALGLVFFVATAIGVFVSIAAILTCYKSVAGERESGSMKLLLALPHTRRDVVLGKVAGRTGVLAVPVVAALLVGAGLGTALLGEVAPLATVLFGLVGLLFALTYAALVVGISATTGSTGRAAALAIGFFLVFELLWDTVVIALVFVANGFVFPAGPGDLPEWTYPLVQLPPSNAFVTSLSAVIPDAPGAAAGPGPGAGQVEAFFGTPWVAVVVLLFWVVVPLALGYRRFARADL